MHTIKDRLFGQRCFGASEPSFSSGISDLAGYALRGDEPMKNTDPSIPSSGFQRPRPLRWRAFVILATSSSANRWERPGSLQPRDGTSLEDRERRPQSLYLFWTRVGRALSLRRGRAISRETAFAIRCYQDSSAPGDYFHSQQEAASPGHSESL
jgi:hypothetical protein